MWAFKANRAYNASEFGSLRRMKTLLKCLCLVGVLGVSFDTSAIEAVSLADVALSDYYPLSGATIRLSVHFQLVPLKSRLQAQLLLVKNGSNAQVKIWRARLVADAKGDATLVQDIAISATVARGDYRLELRVTDPTTGKSLYSNPSLTGFIVSGASSPLPAQTVTALSAFDMLDSMGVGIGLSYQLAPDYPNRPWDLPNRNGEIEAIAALKYLGLHHVRNEGLNDDPRENADRPAPGTNAPDDYHNFLTILAAIPNLKLNYLVQGANPHWGDGSKIDPKPVLLKLAKAGVLAGIEGPNEPNFQCTVSPSGAAYTPCVPGAGFGKNVYHFNQIWTDWGKALRALKQSDAAFAQVPLLPPSVGTWGPNGPDGVEGFYAKSGLSDHSAFYDAMNIHAYGPNGIGLGDPMGDISFGNAPNWAAYPLSLVNWGRYAMPSKPVIVTESGANSRKLPSPAASASEKAQGIALLNTYFWAKYYGAKRVYEYTLADDSTDMGDEKAEKWGFFRGDWSAKPAAHFVHRLTQALADSAQSDAAKIPPFSISGQQAATRGAWMALSKSDGSYMILCNAVLPRWDAKTGADLEPKPESWTLKLSAVSRFSLLDVVTGEESAVQTGDEVKLAIRGYPLVVKVLPGG